MKTLVSILAILVLTFSVASAADAPVCKIVGVDTHCFGSFDIDYCYDLEISYEELTGRKLHASTVEDCAALTHQVIGVKVRNRGFVAHSGRFTFGDDETSVGFQGEIWLKLNGYAMFVKARSMTELVEEVRVRSVIERLGKGNLKAYQVKSRETLDGASVVTAKARKTL